jgi:hypothetical protein
LYFGGLALLVDSALQNYAIYTIPSPPDANAFLYMSSTGWVRSVSYGNMAADLEKDNLRVNDTKQEELFLQLG